MSKEYTLASSLALNSIASWCPGYLSGKLKEDELWMCSPIREDRNPTSFSINIHSGLWYDFADSGVVLQEGNAVQLFATIRGMAEHEAVSFFSHYEGEDDRGTIDDPPATSGFTSRSFYQNQFCSYWIYRYDYEDGKKSFSPWTKVNGQWINKKPEKPELGFPLLHLGRILANPGKEVIIVEGEKTCEAIPKEYIRTTWAGGSNSIETIDFTPLKGREVVLWPDKDAPGFKAMASILKKLELLGCTVRQVTPAEEWPEKTDAADLDEETIKEFIGFARIIYKPRDIFPLTKFGDMEITMPKWIIKGALESNALGSVFGASGTGKSYLALDMAACIATGTPFCDRKIKTPGAVIYIAGEGFGGISRRLSAWQKKRGISLKEAPIFISHKPAALGDEAFMAHVKSSVKNVYEKVGNISLIVIDTWARNMTGDENNTMDTSLAIRAVDDLRYDYQCTALIVHHSGQLEDSRARGSSAFRGALDAEYRVNTNDKCMTVTNTKMKDAVPPEPMRFAFEYVDLGIVDDDDEPVVSSVLIPMDIDDILLESCKLGDTQAFVMSKITENQDGLTKIELVRLIEATGKNRKTAYKAISELVKKGLVKEENGTFLQMSP